MSESPLRAGRPPGLPAGDADGPRWRELALLGLLAAIWSSSFVFIRVAVETIPPMTVTAGRLAIAAAILIAFARAGGHRLPLKPAVWGLFLFIGCFGNALPFTLIGWGEQRIASGLTAILMGIMPVITVLLAHLFTDDERLDLRRAGGVVLGFCGLITLVGVEALSGLGAEVLSQLAVLGGASSYAVTTIFVRRFVRLPGRLMAAGATAAGTLLILPVALLHERPWTLDPSPESLLSVTALGIGATAFATLLYFRLIRRLGATVFSQVNYLVPVLGLGWGMLLLDERPGLQAFAALAMILAGVALVSRRRT